MISRAASPKATGLQRVRRFQKPSNWEAEAGSSPSSRPARSTQQKQDETQQKGQSTTEDKKEITEGREAEREERLAKKAMEAHAEPLGPGLISVEERSFLDPRLDCLKTRWTPGAVSAAGREPLALPSGQHSSTQPRQPCSVYFWSPGLAR